MRRLLIVLAMLGCSSRVVHVDPDDGNVRPFADAGTGSTYALGTTITLDASGSWDPDGTITSFHWRVVTSPDGSHAAIVNPNLATTSFALDAPGTFVFEVTVTDNDGATATSTTMFEAVAPPLISVDAGPDQSVPWKATVHLSGAFVADPAAVVMVQWAIVTAPTGSTSMLAGATTLTPSFVADREGTYMLRFTASTPYQSMSDDLVVTSVVDRQLLAYTLVDAEYSKVLDRFVIVSDVPPKLHLHDPKTGTETTVALPAAPVAVSVSPDGLRAAVAHAMSVSIVDLQTLAVTGPYAMPISIYDLAFGGDNRVHCIERAFSSGHIRTLDLATSQVSDSQNGFVYGYTQIRLHPGGQIAYGATTALSPADIERYDVSSSPVQYVRHSPYHGQYPMGGPLWFTEDGSTIITAAGTLFNVSSDATLDMTYRGALAMGGFTWVSHSAAAGELAGLHTVYDANFNPIAYFLQVYEDQQDTLLRAVEIPDTPVNGTFYRSAGRFVAFRADASKIYVIAKATPSVHALYTFDP